VLNSDLFFSVNDGHVAVSRDASKILAAYGDSYIREFGR
jgi:hypothetical protein